MGGFSIPSYDPGNITSKGGLKRGLANQYGNNTGLEQQQQGQRGDHADEGVPCVPGKRPQWCGIQPPAEQPCQRDLGGCCVVPGWDRVELVDEGLVG